MLENLSESIRECYRRAEDCERQAALQIDPALRDDFLDTARRWIKLAQSYELTERIGRFTFKPDRFKPADGAGTTPFLRTRNGAFDDTVTQLIGEAFDAVCAHLGNISALSRHAVADRIIDAATNGERDLIRLRDAGMDALRPKRR